MLYLCSANLTDYALQNLNEIAQTVPDGNTRLFVMTGGTTSDIEKFSQFKHQTTALKPLIDAMGKNDFSGSVGKDNYQYWEYIPSSGKSGVFKEIKVSEKGMNDPNILKGFINLCYGFAGKDCKYILDLWGHAGGSLIGLIADSNYENDLMSLEEFKSAIDENNYIKNGGRFETVIFNTCLMQSYEMAGIVAKHSHYMIGSEENSSALGPDYKSFIQYLYDNPSGNGKDFGEVFCSTALKKIEYLPDIFNQATWSNIDLSKYSDVETAFNALVECVDNKQAISNFNLSFLNQANAGFFTNFGFAGGQSGMFDLVYLAKLMKTMYPECSIQADKLVSAVNGMVVSNYAGDKITASKHPNGISVFFDSWCFPKKINNTLMLGSMVNSDYYDSYSRVIDNGYARFLENLSNAVRFIPNLNTWQELDGFVSKTSITSISFLKTSSALDSPIICYKNTSGTELYFVSNDVIYANPDSRSMFEGFKNLKTLNLSNLDTSYALYMSRFFYGLSELEEIRVDADKWIILQQTDVSDMFTGCKTDHVSFV